LAASSRSVKANQAVQKIETAAFAADPATVAAKLIYDQAVGQQKVAEARAALRLPLNEQIVSFCQQAMGKQVGGGQCSHLADGAVTFAGARNWPGLTPRGSDDYVWGELVCVIEGNSRDFSKAMPGDIIQMRGVQFEGASGRAWAEHHTAIVKELVAGDIVTFEQNHKGQLFVVENTYHMAEMKSGWMRIYRPIH